MCKSFVKMKGIFSFLKEYIRKTFSIIYTVSHEMISSAIS